MYSSKILYLSRDGLAGFDFDSSRTWNDRSNSESLEVDMGSPVKRYGTDSLSEFVDALSGLVSAKPFDTLRSTKIALVSLYL